MIPWEFVRSEIWWGQRVVTPEVGGADNVPVRTNKHGDVIRPQMLHDARAKCLEGINKTAGSLNNVK